MAGTPEHPSIPQHLSGLMIRLDVDVREFIRETRIIGSKGLQAVGVGLAVLTAARSLREPAPSDWTGGTPWRTALFVLTLAWIVGSWLAIAALKRGLSWHEKRAGLVDSCHLLRQEAARPLGIGVENAGAHIWLARGLPGARYLDLYAKAPYTAPQADIIWCKGRGLLGMAWKRDKILLEDIAKLRRGWPDQATFEEERPAERYNLTWKQFQATRRYSAVVAIPLRIRRRFWLDKRALVTVELFCDGHADDLGRLSDEGAFDTVLEICKDALRAP